MKYQSKFRVVFLLSSLIYSIYAFGAEVAETPENKEPTNVEAAAPVVKEKSPARFWGSVGPTLIDSNGGYWGARIAAGIDLHLGAPRRFMLGVLASKPFSGEKLEGRFEGDIQRLYLLPNVGFYFIPETFWVRGLVGLGFLSGAHKDVVAKVKPAVGVSTGYKMELSERFDLGVELAYEYSDSASTSVAFVADEIGCAFGVCTGSGTVPRAHIWSLNFVFGAKP